MNSRVRFLLAGGVTYVGAVVLGYGYSSYREMNACKTPGHHDHQHEGIKLSDEERKLIYAFNAPKYDDGKVYQGFLC
jgi:hypothetical protein